MNQALTDEQLKRIAPSVFAENAWHEQSEQYRFIPTINVVNGLRDSGFVPVRAQQSSSRIEGKREFTKHILRFRRIGDYQVNDIIPEIILINAHDGTASYQLSLGLYRLVCQNGLTVGDATLDSIRVTHRGSRDLCRDVIDVSARILDDAPKAIEVVNRWKGLELSEPEQKVFAGAALQLYDTALDVNPDRLLQGRRREDHRAENGTRDLWKTYNVVQENVIRGGLLGKTGSGLYRRTKKVTSVDRDVKLNKALWELSAKMAELKEGQLVTV